MELREPCVLFSLWTIFLLLESTLTEVLGRISRAKLQDINKFIEYLFQRTDRECASMRKKTMETLMRFRPTFQGLLRVWDHYTKATSTIFGSSISAQWEVTLSLTNFIKNIRTENVTCRKKTIFSPPSILSSRGMFIFNREMYILSGRYILYSFFQYDVGNKKKL